MVATSYASGLKGHLIPAIAVLAGIGVAAGVATAPGDTLNALLARADLARFVPAAAPPIGATGRTLLALVAGGLIALLGFAGRIGPFGAGKMMQPDPSTPVVRRADAHPDAPPRRPIRANADFGAPLPLADAEPLPPPRPKVAPGTPPVVQALPADLDPPLADFDPGALPDEPREPVRAVPSLVKARVAEGPLERPVLAEVPAPLPLAPGERIDIFDLTPPPPATGAPGDQSIGALLARLEAVTARRNAQLPAEANAAPVAAPSAPPVTRPALVPPLAPATFVPANLDETLQKLRRLAAAG